ncbi:MAG: hypothetical protein IJD71_01700 [Clostridia bacterium]|nr:hypothetical protein [Clostridia bacterium]MBQ4131034.1 hypothetical protein [Clostridia bacterium]MBQ7107626.1 hypothetical protein [Clostridia bacterium]MBQ9919519.1 hypothetical protein [Clostridia bacterium]
MFQDSDMKIVGEKPSNDVKRNKELYGDLAEYENEKAKGNIEKAKKLGKQLAEDFVSVCKKDELTISEDDSESLITQKVLLLSFTVMAGLEEFCPNITVANAARTAFFDELNLLDNNLFEKSSDTGAFSFYYLSFRRGTEVDRRVGQTFAMLCSHDGDPIYQELGEALYCWFLSTVQERCKSSNF